MVLVTFSVYHLLYSLMYLYLIFASTPQDTDFSKNKASLKKKANEGSTEDTINRQSSSSSTLCVTEGLLHLFGMSISGYGTYQLYSDKG